MLQARSIILLLFTVGFYGCLQTPNPEYPKRVNYTFNVASVGDTLEINEDKLYVSEFKMLADEFNMVLTDGTILQSQPDGIIMGYRDTNEDDELVLGADIGYEDLTHYSGMDLFIAPPVNSANIQDNDFFGDENNYSLIIKGSYNEKIFTYRSSPNFEKNFEFEEVVLTESEPTLVLRVLLDAEEILTGEEGNLLDPDNEENKATIDSLMQISVELEAFSANNPFEQS